MNQDVKFTPQGVILPDISSIPAQISYFFVLIYNSYLQAGNKGITAHILTYRDDPTLRDLMRKFRSETGFSAPKAQSYFFTLQSRRKLDSAYSMSDLKRQLGRDPLDGILLYVQSSLVQENMENECCVIEYFQKEIQYGGSNKIQLRCEVSMYGCPNTEIVYTEFQKTDFKNFFLKRLLGEVSKQFGLKELNLDRINQSRIISKLGMNPEELKNGRMGSQKIYKESTVIIRLSNPYNEELKRKVGKYDCPILIYKDDKSDPITLNYKELAHLTVKDLCNFLQPNQLTKHRDTIYCLKIMDQVLSPEEKINAAEAYFKVKDSKVVAKVVTSKMIFYEVVSKLAVDKSSEFKLSDIIIPQSQKNAKKELQKQARNRAKLVPNDYFKIHQNLSTIMIYTSQIKFLDKKTQEVEVIYQSINNFLRTTNILSLDKQKQKQFCEKWKLRYASTLLKHLQQINPYNGNTWRGINYDPCLSEHNTGQVITFKQFISTSKLRSIAANFARKSTLVEPYRLFCLKVKTGRQIASYSLYPEEEVLLQPYSEFQFKGITKTKIEGNQFIVYNLDEITTSKSLPQIKANFIVWIDPNFQESEYMFKQSQWLSQYSILQKLKSTSELEQWLNNYKELFSNKTASLAFVTNMRRLEGSSMNEYAGIDSVNLIRRYSNQVPIFFFISNILAATNKLAASNINLNKISVGNSRKDAFNFFKNSFPPVN